MDPTSAKKHGGRSRSVAFRLTYYVVLVTIVGIAGVCGVYYSYQQALEREELSRVEALVHSRRSQIADSLRRLREEVKFLADTPALNGLARTRAADEDRAGEPESVEVARRRLESLFSSLLRQRPEYSQIRLIDSASGAEIVRVDRTGSNQITVVADENLQRKSSRRYFIEAARMPPESVYFSDVTLNREYGSITLPWEPTIRAATPVYGEDGKTYAVLVINQNLKSLFDDLVRGMGSHERLYVTNSEGDYLLDSEQGLGFGFDLGLRKMLQTDLPAVGPFFDSGARVAQEWFEVRSAGASRKDAQFVHLQKAHFDPGRPDRYLAIGYRSSRASLLGTSGSAGRRTAWLAVILMLLCSVFAPVYVRRTLRPLRKIARSAELVADGNYDVELPPAYEGEVGNLSRSFHEMIRQVEARTKRIEEQGADLAATNARLELAKREVEEKVQEVEQVSQYRAQFLARISHDLRTPLNSMLILADSLAENRDGNLNDEEVQSATILAGAGRDLLDLLNDLLELSRAEAGSLEILEEKTQIFELLERVRVQFGPLAQAKQVSFDIRIDPKLPKWIVTDPRRIRQILWNLTSNALKFTDEGSVTIEAGVAPAEPGGDGKASGCLLLRVEDSGPGIDPTQVEHICSPYQNLEWHVRAGRAGTGLGLAIVREIATALGGELEVTSEVGRGSCFMVRLPLKTPERNRAPVLLSAKRQIGRSAHVLIADDDEISRWALTRTLRSLDSEIVVDEVDTGPEALEALASGRYGAVVLDYHLPGMHGLEVIRRLCGDSSRLPPRAFLYTGRDLRPEERVEAEAMALEVVSKQGDKDSLRAFARRILERETTAAGNRPLEGMRLLFAEDDLASKFALKRELCRFGALVEDAENGYEALSTLRDRTDFHAVIMDIRMPVMDGYEAIRRLRANPLHGALPVLALTADATEEDRQKCLQIGASEFLTKPVDPEHLATRISSLVGSN